MTAETFSDLLGFLSGIALLVTAWRNDGLWGFVSRLRQSVEQAKQSAKAPDKKAADVVASLETELTNWSTVDRWAMRVGAGLLVLSFAFKVGPKFGEWVTSLLK